ncbi:hypothetical protein EYZ11_006365 [Aspergillus tanneri]|nr:hypothetical protein EYZ11_006365 [Aspergillus tanneri]
MYTTALIGSIASEYLHLILHEDTYLRVFIVSRSKLAVAAVAKVMKQISLKLFSGSHSRDMRATIPRPSLAYYPAFIKQAEAINFVDGPTIQSFDTVILHDTNPFPAGKLRPRRCMSPFLSPETASSWRNHLRASRDKMGNFNFGIFVSTALAGIG